MLKSEKRILATHVGSLPRNPKLTDLLLRQGRGEAIDKKLLDRESEAAVSHVVERQLAAGIDIVTTSGGWDMDQTWGCENMRRSSQYGIRKRPK